MTMLRTQRSARIRIALVLPLLGTTPGAFGATSVASLIHGAHATDATGVAEEELCAAPTSASLPAPTWVPLGTRPGATVRNESDVVLGILRDHVVRARDGAVTHVVLETAVRAVLVPWDRFLWLGEERDPVLTLGVAQVAAMPPFEPERWRPERTASGREEAARRPLQELLGSHLLAARVEARAEPFGMVRQVVLDPRGGRVGFALVWTGSDDSLVVVPWDAFRARLSARPDGCPVLALSRCRSELTGAPRLAQQQLSTLAQPDVARAVHEFYGVTSMSGIDSKFDTR